MTTLKHSLVGECFFIRRFVLAVVGAMAILTLSACGTRTEEPSSGNVVFEIDLDQVGPIYENETLGVKYRPPVNWDKLEGDHRQAVLDGLALSSDDDGDYSLDVTDIFFDIDSMSFSSISVVTGAGGNPTVNAYVEAFGATLGLDDGDAAGDDNALVARMEFSVDNVPIVQFRHFRSNRVTFTLLFSSKTGYLIQLDYSIPTENYRREAVKLESSIGTLQLISLN